MSALSEAAPFGAVIDGEADPEALLARLADSGIRHVELLSGPQQLAGLHLGAVPRHGIRDAFAEAAITIIALASRIDLQSAQPDEGVVADIDDHLKLAEDLGAGALLVTAGGAPASAVQRPSAGEMHQRVAQRLTAVLSRAAELRVRMVVSNSGSAASAAALAAILRNAEEFARENEVPGPGAVWNVKDSVAAGGTLDESARLLQPFLSGRGYIRCETAAAAAALLAAVPAAADVPIVVEAEAAS